ncbi:MAG: hypothetical protein AAGB12_07400 [Pseudomonadota bacterium]
MITIKKIGIVVSILFFLNSSLHAADNLNVDGYVSGVFHNIIFNVNVNNELSVKIESDSNQVDTVKTFQSFFEKNDVHNFDDFSMSINVNNEYKLKFKDEVVSISAKDTNDLYLLIDFFSKTNFFVEVLDEVTIENNVLDDSNAKSLEKNYSNKFLEVVTTQTNPHDDGSTGPTGNNIY